MRTLIVGLGVQGRKRLAIAGREAVAIIDPAQPEAQYQSIEQVPLQDFDSALVCTPDAVKIPILRYLLSNGKHVLVEKPLVGSEPGELEELSKLAQSNGAVCYTAYNHRFEPHIASLQRILDSGRLGKVYSADFFYGNGTARDVRNSEWRDEGAGVLPDLGSHLLDTILFLFGEVEGACRTWRADRFENRAYDRFIFGFQGPLPIDCTMTLLSYRNSFFANVYCELGSAHINCLCKWGPSILTVRTRVFPSGRPDEESTTLVCPDPTWKMEYEYFKKTCAQPKTNLGNDIWIQSRLLELTGQLA